MTWRQESSPTMRFWNLIKAFEDRAGYGILINTSFNVRGEPIVCTPRDAYRCFMRTDMDVLVLENLVLEKGDQPDSDPLEAAAAGVFPLD